VTSVLLDHDGSRGAAFDAQRKTLYPLSQVNNGRSGGATNVQMTALSETRVDQPPPVPVI